MALELRGPQQAASQAACLARLPAFFCPSASCHPGLYLVALVFLFLSVSLSLSLCLSVCLSLPLPPSLSLSPSLPPSLCHPLSVTHIIEACSACPFIRVTYALACDAAWVEVGPWDINHGFTVEFVWKSTSFDRMQAAGEARHFMFLCISSCLSLPEAKSTPCSLSLSLFPYLCTCITASFIYACIQHI